MRALSRIAAGVGALVMTIALAGCGSGSSGSASVASTATSAATTSTTTAAQPKSERTYGQIAITSPAFKAGGPIAARYTCDGANVSPPLRWHGVPAGTAELFLLAVAVGSAGETVEWALAGIRPSTRQIAAGALPAGAFAGVNGAGKPGWGGLCGPKGSLQRVIFVLYALNRKLILKPGFDPVAVRNGLTGASLARGLTLATYTRA